MTADPTAGSADDTGPALHRGRVLSIDADPFDIGADAAVRFIEDGAIAVENGRIRAIGAFAELRGAVRGAAIHDHGDRWLAPGFVDCHLHYPQIGVIGSYGAQLLDWLETYTFPEEATFCDFEKARRAARAFFDETLRNGITTTCSFCTIHPASVDAYFEEAARRGLRALGGKVMMDRNAPAALRDEAEASYDDSKALAEKWDGRGRLSYVVTPRFAPTSSPAQLEAAGALWAERPGALMQTHLSENLAEIAWVAELFPGAPDYLGVYERFGLLGAGAIFGHAIHLTDRERARLAEAEASVAHCPTSNAFLGSGACDVDGLARAGVRIGLANDVGGGSSFSAFDTMKAAYELAQSRGVSLTAAHLWWLATAGSARALRLDGAVGRLSPGADADFVVLDPAATPILASRTARAETVLEAMFAMIVLADDRAISETWASGARVHAR